MRKISSGLFSLCVILLLFLSACQQELVITMPPEEDTAAPEEPAPEEPTAEPEAMDQPAEVVEVSLTDLLEAGTAMKWYDEGYLVFVPGGEVLLGDSQLENNPEHMSKLDDYWIYMFPVTNGQYDQCVAAGACSAPASGEPYPDVSDPALRDDPVVGVTWDQAGNYCEWMKGRLPTRDEWEKAARGPQSDTFPWGEGDATCDLLNFSDCQKLEVTKVYQYPEGRSYYQAFDLAGNTFEWVFDLYEDDIVSQLPGEEPYFPPLGTERSVRGSSYISEADLLPAAALYYLEPDQTRPDLGFRCVIGEAQPESFASPCVQAAYVPGVPPEWQPGPQHDPGQAPIFDERLCKVEPGYSHSVYCSNPTLQQGGLDLTIYGAGADEVYLKSWSSSQGVACLEGNDPLPCFGPELAPVTFEICAACTPPVQIDIEQLYCDCGYALSGSNPPTCVYNGAPPQPGQTCPAGFVYDPVDDICRKMVMQSQECQAGYEYDQNTQCCVATYAEATTNQGTSPSSYLLCPPGYGNTILAMEWVYQGSGICLYLGTSPQVEKCGTVTLNLGECCIKPGQYTEKGPCEAAQCRWVPSPTGAAGGTCLQP